MTLFFWDLRLRSGWTGASLEVEDEKVSVLETKFGFFFGLMEGKVQFLMMLLLFDEDDLGDEEVMEIWKGRSGGRVGKQYQLLAKEWISI